MMNQKQRARKHQQRTYNGPRNPTAVTIALGRVNAAASEAGVQVTSTYVQNMMMTAGYLPDGDGRWRSMTPVERKRWLGKDA